MKQSIFNRTHRIQSKSSSPIALIMPKRSDHSRTHFHRICVVGLFRMRFLRALSHANFRNARPIELSQRLPNELFCAHFHSTSHKSLHGKPEQADAAQTMSRFCKKWQKFAVVNGLSTPKNPPKMLHFCKTPGHDLPKAGTMHPLSCTTANLCQKVDNSDQISSKSKLFKKAPTVDSKQARSKHEEKMKETEERGKGRSNN